MRLVPKQIMLITIFFIFTPLTLGVALFSLLTLNSSKLTNTQHYQKYLSTNVNNGVNIYAALPKTIPAVEARVNSSDARSELVRQYLARYNSPLEKYSEYIVKIADEAGIDFRFIPAIAQQESNLCKFIPPGGHNCWGWGIHSRGTLGFESYEAAIETVTFGLKKNYIDMGLRTPEEIMKKYTPSSNGSWANGVSTFMNEML